MSTDEEDDIIRAINLSLKEAAAKPTVINLDSDGEEEEEEEDVKDDDEAKFEAELQRALKASAAEASSRQPKAAAPDIQIVQPPAVSSFLSERAQLEKERRERQKRLRPDASYGGDLDGESGVGEPPAKRQHVSSLSGVRANNGRPGPVPLSSYSTRNAAPSSSSANVATIDQVFWNAECRQTATQHAEPRKDGRPTFRLTEVLGRKSELSFAIMSSYALDIPWIYEFFDRTVPVIMVAQPDETGRPSLKNVLPNWIKATPVLRGGRGCMHMKFMLLFYKTGRLRVVVSTANLIAYDYRDMENTIWLQDVPLRPSPIPHDRTATDDFPAVFQYVLHSLNVHAALSTMLNDNHPDLPLKSIDELRMRWDWSKVKAHLIPSIAGRHEGWPSVIRTGHPRLMKGVRSIGMRTGNGRRAKALTIECQGSSLGNYTTQWLNEFHWSARGESAEDWLDEPKRRREKMPYPAVKVVFPTLATVKDSKLGEQGGGTIFCRRRQWAAKNFPRDHFYDSKSKGGPVLMHAKMIIATYKDASSSLPSTSRGSGSAQAAEEESGTETEDDDDGIEVIEPPVGWAYVGSHNFTPSAWGTLSGSGFNPVLNISNYELGVLVLLKDEQAVERVACWERPPRRYVRGKDEPWIQEESVYHQDG